VLPELAEGRAAGAGALAGGGLVDPYPPDADLRSERAEEARLMVAWERAGRWREGEEDWGAAAMGVASLEEA
jgi:hypothetical protein